MIGLLPPDSVVLVHHTEQSPVDEAENGFQVSLEPVLELGAGAVFVVVTFESLIIPNEDKTLLLRSVPPWIELELNGKCHVQITPLLLPKVEIHEPREGRADHGSQPSGAGVG